MKRLSTFPLGNRTLAQLARIALRSFDSDRSWKAVRQIHLRGGPDTLALARTLARARSWRKRALGMHITSQLSRSVPGSRWERTEYALDETRALLLNGLRDAHDGVVSAAASAMGHRPHPAALMELVRLSTHPDRQLRFNVTFALGNYEDPVAIDTLLVLATDAADDVRDWATFGLGTLQDADTPAIRDRLWLNLKDIDEDVRGEALCGLAKRGDPRAVEHLVEHLDDECRVYELDSAEVLADPLLLAPLQNIAAGLDADERDGYWFNCLQRALSACADAARQSSPQSPDPTSP